MIKFGLVTVVSMMLVISAYGQNDLLVESETNKGQTAETDQSVPTEEAPQKDPVAVPPPKGKVPKGLALLGMNNYFAGKAIVLDKQRRTLSIWQADKTGRLSLVKAYPSDYGRKPGDKQVVGDLKTPEGIYFFEETYFGAQLDFNEYGQRAFTMDYPNYFDRKERKTGSGIWLHAIPPTKSLLRGSRGCIVVRNEAIDEIKQHISLKNMPIVVYDYVEYVSQDTHLEEQKQFLSWLESWKKSWMSKDIDQYISFYDDSFNALRMNKEQWREYKQSLNEKYEFIKVGITEPMIVTHKDEVVIRFMQQYRSDQNGDVGEKTLYVKRNDMGDFKIVHEKWAEVSKETLAAKGLPGDFSQAAN
ncbi:MAG: L,D-transpeptidase family protein [Bdellovibrionales bacterium]